MWIPMSDDVMSKAILTRARLGSRDGIRSVAGSLETDPGPIALRFKRCASMQGVPGLFGAAILACKSRLEGLEKHCF